MFSKSKRIVDAIYSNFDHWVPVSSRSRIEFSTPLYVVCGQCLPFKTRLNRSGSPASSLSSRTSPRSSASPRESVRLLPGVDDATFRRSGNVLATKTPKFSPSEVDSPIVHSVHLLEELDREVKSYGVRVREWRLITVDNLLFA
jgi:hypothetical protein